MEYVELLRARRTLVAIGCVLLLPVLACLYVAIFVHPTFPAPIPWRPDGNVVHGALGVSDLFAWIAATVAGTGLAREAATLPFTWTRPAPRASIAWRLVAVDLATIVVAYGLATLCLVLCVTIAGLWGRLHFEGLGIMPVVLGLSVAFMWYGLIVLATARVPGRAGLIAGLSWPVFTIGASLLAAQFPSAVHTVIVAINYLNPLNYYETGHGTGINIAITTDASSYSRTVLQYSLPMRALATACIAAGALAAGVRLWATREI